MRVDAFLDGEHFAVMCKAGQAPVDAVARSMKRRLGADVMLWPSERTPAGVRRKTDPDGIRPGIWRGRR